MTNTIRSATTAAALAVALAAPLAASAATSTSAPPQRYTMHTRYFDDHHAGEYDGLLLLTVYPSGIVQGMYRDESVGGFRTVTGGLEAQNHIWLDIGSEARPLRLYGTLQDGVLRTTANTSDVEQHFFESVSVTKTS